jgi:hypothetical protein
MRVLFETCSAETKRKEKGTCRTLFASHEKAKRKKKKEHRTKKNKMANHREKEKNMYVIQHLN